MKEIIEKLKKRSEKFLKHAFEDFKEKDFDLCMFNTEQSIQLMLKAKILEFGVQFPKVNDIFELIETLEKFGVDLKNIKEKYKETIKNLNIAYIGSRYLPISFSEEDAEKALGFAKELKEILWK
ncbi:MAG: HEPN domain-containing protein [Candidatus Aenigmatarchaeota archaeon]